MVWAQTEQGPQPVRPEAWQNFETLVHAIHGSQQDLDDARKRLAAASIDSERARYSAEVERITQEVMSLQIAWEMWATGGVDLQLFEPQTDQKKFDWREELQSVFEPIVIELRRVTERPRKIERLRGEQAYYSQRLQAAESALKSVAVYRSGAPSSQLKDAFSDLESRWQKRRDDVKGRLDLVNFELQELLAPDASAEFKAREALKELLSGRLVNLLLALAAAGAVYGLLWQVNRLYAQSLMRRGRYPAFFTRAVNLVLVMIGTILALFAAMAVLYARGDWILLGLLMLVLVGLALTLQRSLPAYITEVKLMLNIGSVKEGERIIYNGLPWKVQSLRIASTLVNPALRGGRLVLPVRLLGQYTSRRYDENELWFPTRENDFVLLNDGSFGQVTLQTPEIVQVRVAGAVKTFPVMAFLDLAPHNLSQDGFSITVKFGVDYQHQALVISEIRDKLEKYISVQLGQHASRDMLRKLSVEFSEAGASSLDFVITADYEAGAAKHYLQLRRWLRRLAVEAANSYNWVIPFDQLQVHIAGRDDSIERLSN
ncbi:MAG: hypothetical protein HY272_07925 [Gammaproteobacteria bacterium]|nr:hypothetical protein [Gammaproteobacteria bacterium]